MADEVKTGGETKYDPTNAPVTKFGGRGEEADGKVSTEDPKNFYGKGEPTE